MLNFNEIINLLESKVIYYNLIGNNEINCKNSSKESFYINFYETEICRFSLYEGVVIYENSFNIDKKPRILEFNNMYLIKQFINQLSFDNHINYLSKYWK